MVVHLNDLERRDSPFKPHLTRIYFNQTRIDQHALNMRLS
jgi:hypothetical protein